MQSPPVPAAFQAQGLAPLTLGLAAAVLPTSSSELGLEGSCRRFLVLTPVSTYKRAAHHLSISVKAFWPRTVHCKGTSNLKSAGEVPGDVVRRERCQQADTNALADQLGRLHQTVLFLFVCRCSVQTMQVQCMFWNLYNNFFFSQLIVLEGFEKGLVVNGSL